jgi:hypothetical protein
MKLKSCIPLLVLALLLSACVTIQMAAPTPLPPAPTIRPKPSLTPLPTFTPITPAPTSQPGQGATQVKIFLIAINDNGASGKKIGCNDSVVPVQMTINPTVVVLRASLDALFQLKGQRTYGSSGLYNALYQSSLSIDSLTIINREAVIKLKGSLVQGGVCDSPRIKAQLEETGLQFSTIDKTTIFINGVPLNQLLSGQG